MRPCDTLTDRQRQVIDLVTLGDTNPMIAYRLNLSLSRISKVIFTVMNKLGLHKRWEIVQWRLSRRT